MTAGQNVRQSGGVLNLQFGTADGVLNLQFGTPVEADPFPGAARERVREGSFKETALGFHMQKCASFGKNP